MDIARRNEIAFKYLSLKIRKDGINLGQNTRREIGNTAKEIGITSEEATEFAEMMVRGIVDEIFSAPAPKTGTTTTRV